MAQLVGNNAIETASVTGSAGQAVASKFTAEGTGTVAEIQVRTGSGAMTGMTGVEIGIFADNAGKPGTLLGSAVVSGKPGKEVWVVASGLSVAVTSSTEYWLAAIGFGGTLSLVGKTGGTSGERKSLTGKTYAKLSEANEWNAALTKAPLSMFAASVPAGVATASAGLGASPTGARGVKVTAAASAGIEASTVGAAQQRRSAATASVAVEVAAQGGRQTSGIARASAALGAAVTAETPPIFLIGSQVEPLGTPASIGLASGHPETFRFQAGGTGLVTTLEVHIGGGGVPTATALRVAVRSDVGGAPGAVISEAVREGKPEENTTYPVLGLSAQVIVGRFYWLSVMATGGSAHLRVTNPAEPVAHSASLKGKNAVALISEETEWEPDTSNGPMLLYGLGHPTPSAVSKATLGLNSGALGTRATSGTASASGALGASAEGEVTGGGRGKGKATLGLRSTPAAQRAASGTARASLGLEAEIKHALNTVTTIAYYTGLPYTKKTPANLNAGEPFLDAYPATKAGSPLLCILHGGGGVQGYPGEFGQGTEAATQFQKGAVKGQPGGAAVNIEYFLADATHGWLPHGLEDALKAVEWAIEHAAELNANPSKVFILGGSAGCALAALVAQSCAAKGIPIKGVIELSPFTPDWRLLTEEEEATNEAEEATGPLANSKITGDHPLILHTQFDLQQSLPPGVFFNRAGYPELTTTPTSRAYQETWSVARTPVLSSAKRLIVSSAPEVVSERQAQKWWEHLIAEGKWTGACKRVLRTIAKTESHANGFVEEAVGEGVQEGVPTGAPKAPHGFAYLTESEQWPNVLAFIFAIEGVARASVGMRSADTATRKTSGAAAGSMGTRGTTEGGHAIRGSASMGLRLSTAASVTRLTEARASVGLRSSPSSTREAGGVAAGSVGLELVLVGGFPARGKSFASMGVSADTEGERELDRPGGIPRAGHIAVVGSGRIGP